MAEQAVIAEVNSNDFRICCNRRTVMELDTEHDAWVRLPLSMGAPLGDITQGVCFSQLWCVHMGIMPFIRTCALVSVGMSV